VSLLLCPILILLCLAAASLVAAENIAAPYGARVCDPQQLNPAAAGTITTAPENADSTYLRRNPSHRAPADHLVPGARVCDPQHPGLATAAVLANTPASPPPECVILLHGLSRTSASMKRLQWFLQKQGYRVVNLSYPSTKQTIEQLADEWLPENLALHDIASASKLHFVTHSMGGILVRQYLSRRVPPNLGRVVMLAPPNHGSEIMDSLRRHCVTRWFLSPAHLELGTSVGDVPQKLGPVQFDCGVIAGDTSLNPLLSWFLPGPNDGKVTVASAKVDGMAEFLVVHHSHTWLMWRKDVLIQTLKFLQSGRFAHG